MKNPKMQETKHWLKATAVLIRRLKQQHKDCQRKGKDDWKEYAYLNGLRREYRHRLIAYAEIRGRTRDQIEKTHKLDENGQVRKPLDEAWIQELKNEILAGIVHEDVA